MDADDVQVDVSAVAGAIAEPARTRMLWCLMDGHARTATELAVVAGVSPSTASVHLARLKEQRLVEVLAQGRHRYYRLNGTHVAAALEALAVLAGAPRHRFVPNTPSRLRTARTCYDHMAGGVAVALHDRLLALGWLCAEGRPQPQPQPQPQPHLQRQRQPPAPPPSLAALRRRGDAGDDNPEPAGMAPRLTAYALTDAGTAALQALGIDTDAARARRRRFACACVDWSERRPHLGGALGAALLALAVKRRWVVQAADSRALRVTRLGERELAARFQLPVAQAA